MISGMEFYMPGRLITGKNCIANNAGRLKALGSRCLLVTGGSSAKCSGALADVTSALEEQGIAWSVFDRITPNPSVASCQEGGREAAAFRAAFIIGIGGGSPLDAAKAVSVFAANPELTEAEFYSAKWPHAPLPIVLAGTTAGTGSEVTSVSVLTDSAGKKHSIHDDRLYAAYAFGDARYTASLPRSVTLSAGIDAVAHCIESAFSKKADQLSRLFAAQGVRLAVPVLTAAAEKDCPEASAAVAQKIDFADSAGNTSAQNTTTTVTTATAQNSGLAVTTAAAADIPLTLPQREQLYDASILGGLAINRTGTVFPHNVGYYLTERFGIPHGFASAYLMPALLDHMKHCVPDAADAFYQEAGITEDILRTLLGKCLPPLTATATEEEIRSALPRWRSNGTVRNTLGTVSEEQIYTALAELLMT